MTLEITKVTCTKCGYTWAPRTGIPKRCPECQVRHPLKERKDGTLIEQEAT